jgi:hypothetical protein
VVQTAGSQAGFPDPRNDGASGGRPVRQIIRAGFPLAPGSALNPGETLLSTASHCRPAWRRRAAPRPTPLPRR